MLCMLVVKQRKCPGSPASPVWQNAKDPNFQCCQLLAMVRTLQHVGMQLSEQPSPLQSEHLLNGSTAERGCQFFGIVTNSRAGANAPHEQRSAAGTAALSCCWQAQSASCLTAPPAPAC